ncbi:MAG: hypothetical protein QNJ88_06920 [Acidimicrobiia bacterium]|nr:hypothetical protein [Acidimicrobiia bacterium]
MDRQPTAPQLEPLRFGELIDAGFRLWRKGFKDLFIVAAIITIPVGVLSYILERGQVLAIGDGGVLIVRDTTSYAATALSIAVLSIGASFLSAGATLVLTTRGYIGTVPSWQDGFRVAVARLFPFIGLSLLIGLAIVAGFIALIIPGIFIGLGLAFATVAFWAEGTRATESMGRSWDLARGRRWPLLGLLLFSAFAFAITGIVVTAPLLAAAFSNNTELFLFADNVGNAVVSALVSPLASCLLTAAYYDARVRREGFDLQLAASMLDEPEEDPDEPPPSIFR